MLQSLPACIPTRICLGVCTYGRPLMLTKCLASLQAMDTPAGCELDIVVVDNNPAPVEQGLVGCYRTHAGDPITYVHEPRRGIAQARNAILDFAEEIGADFIAMLDDDQIVPPDWLEEMVASQQSYDADVVKSAVQYDYPEPLPRWAFPSARPPKWRYGARMAATSGVLFRSSLTYAYPGLALRFNEEFALTSGEDRDFFTRAYLAGAEIVHTPRAISTEFMPESKLRFWTQVYRVYTQEIMNTVQDRRFYGALPALLTKSFKATGCLISGPLFILFAPFAYLGDSRYGRRQLLKGAKRIAKACGIYVGFVGLVKPEPYRTIHGE